MLPAGSPGASGSPAPSASPAAVASPSTVPTGATLKLTAFNLLFDLASLSVAADVPFKIALDNQDTGLPHNVEIKDAKGISVWKGDLVTGPTQVTYTVPALPAGEYTFSCSTHPTTMNGTLKVGG
jgi:plastocyanin